MNGKKRVTDSDAPTLTADWFAKARPAAQVLPDNVLAAARYSLADATEILAEVSAAVDRLDAGAYGECETCGQGIGIERLRLRPYVRTCVGCAGGARRS